jgi:hypothetical protein
VISLPYNGSSAAVVDVDQLAELVADRLAQRLASRLPDATTEFWIALVERAAAERRRAAGLAGIDCTCTGRTTKDALDGILPNGGEHEPTDDRDATAAPLDPDPGHAPAYPVGRR